MIIPGCSWKPFILAVCLKNEEFVLFTAFQQAPAGLDSQESLVGLFLLGFLTSWGVPALPELLAQVPSAFRCSCSLQLLWHQGNRNGVLYTIWNANTYIYMWVFWSVTSIRRLETAMKQSIWRRKFRQLRMIAGNSLRHLPVGNVCFKALTKE